MKNRKFILLVAAIAVFFLAIPFWAEESTSQPVFLYVRYLLALTIAFPTIQYAIKKYRQTATRFYVLPCFSIFLGFLFAGMFFSMKISESKADDQQIYAISSEDEGTFDGKDLLNDKHINLAKSWNNYFNEDEKL